MGVNEIIRMLGMKPHPEGGHYVETWRDAPGPDGRARFTAIYFLLAHDEISHLHRLRSDEVWHFYRGAALRVHVFAPDGGYRAYRLGHDLAGGERCQLVVPRGHWFGAEVIADSGFALVGNTVAPGFDFADFELARAEALTAAYPGHADLVHRMCRY